MFTRSRSLWRRTTWFAIFITVFFSAVSAEWDKALVAWAQGGLPDWETIETGTPLEIVTDNPAADGSRLCAKVRALGNHPVRIYEFVRNEVTYEAYRGCRFGARGTLDRLRGNDVDQALLLVAMLRQAYRNLNHFAPDLSLVCGSAKIDGRRACLWLGVDNGEAARDYLTMAGVRHSLSGDPAGTDFTLTLINHVWVRGDLEFGATRGSRFVTGEDGILADLDPSFVAMDVVDEAPSPLALTGIDATSFQNEVSSYAKRAPATGSVSEIPERLMLEMVDSGASVFRRRLKEEGLTIERVLSRRVATVDQIDALPDALPFELDGQDPTVYPIEEDYIAVNDFLDQARQRLQVRVIDPAGDNAELAKKTVVLSRAYGTPLIAYFGLPTGAALSTEQLGSQALGVSGILVEAKLQLGDTAADSEQVQVAYGAPVVLETALQVPTLGAGTPGDPLEDPLAAKTSRSIPAGSMYAIAALPSLNDASADAYATQMREHGNSVLTSVNPASPLEPSETLGPILDFAAQAILSQTDSLVRLGALATGHRAAVSGEWAMVGLEPVPGASNTMGTPRFVFVARDGAVPMGAVRSEGDPWLADSDGVQALLQFTREALLSYGPTTALGGAVKPVTAGRLVRDGNNANLPTYALTNHNADLMEWDTVRVPEAGTLQNTSVADNVQAIAFEPDQCVLMPAGAVISQSDDQDNSLGLGWGYFARRTAGEGAFPIWSAATLSGNAGTVAFSPQSVDDADKLTPGLLIDSLAGDPSNARYAPLAENAAAGADHYASAARATAQAYAAIAPSLASVLSRLSDLFDSPADVALAVGSAIVCLHALLDEFSRPSVVSVELELTPTGSGPVTTLSPGDVFNPALWSEVTAVVTFNQIMDNVSMEALGTTANWPDAQASVDAPDSCKVHWDMKGAGIFSGCEDHSLDGALDIRVSGSVYGRALRNTVETFIIDTTAPTVAISPVDSTGGSPYKGPFPLPVRGTAEDLHFESYQLAIAPGNPPGADASWRPLAASDTPVAGVGVLGNWDGVWSGADASGAYTLRVQASDEAGNTSQVNLPVYVYNDSRKPVITIVNPIRNALTDDVQFQVVARDGDGSDSNESGLSSFRVWVEYENASVRDTVDGAIKYDIVPKTEIWHDTQFTGAFPVGPGASDDQTCERTITTRQYQARGSGPFTLRARAVDGFGNVATLAKQYTLENRLFASYAFPATAMVVNKQLKREARIFSVTSEYPQDGKLPATVSAEKNGQAQTIALPGYCCHVAEDKRSYVFMNSWDATTTPNDGVFDSDDVVDIGPTGGDGAHAATVSLGDETQRVELFVLDAEDTPGAKITSPTVSILMKDKVPLVDIRGTVECTDLANNGGRSDTQPIERTFPASRPYWMLSYKPHHLPPIIDCDADVQNSLFQNNQQHECNWTEIAHGFSQILNDDPASDPDPDPDLDPVIAQWDVSRLPVGLYDVRLLVTNGYEYAVAVAYDYKVVHSASIPGTRDDDTTPGVLKLRQVDFSVNFEGFPLDVARSYSSLRAQTLSDFGYGWSLDSLSLSITHGDRYLKYNPAGDSPYGDERLQVDISLPDGRTFTYANRPVTGSQMSSNMAWSSWFNEEAFFSRPYGQMLWLPGRISANPYFASFAAAAGEMQRGSSDGYNHVQQYLDSLPDGHPLKRDTPNGAIACLQLEDDSRILFEWATGNLLQFDKGDRPYGAAPNRRLDFQHETLTDEGNPVRETEIKDHLNRGVTVQRCNDPESPAYGLVTEIRDPRGYATVYTYNEKRELETITDRCESVRHLYYEHPDFPHYLTRMVIVRADGEETEIAYDYDDNARLDSIDTGDGAVSMDYTDNGDGTGSQTVTDDTTGGATEVVYDNAGRVTKKTDAAGVVVKYGYQEETVSTGEGLDLVTVPAGAVLWQSEGGVTTTYQYNVAPYLDTSDTYTGYEGIAQRFIEFWTSRLNDDCPNDYDGTGTNLRPGYLTSMQVQPLTVSTPAVGPDGTVTGSNTVDISYISKDPTGKVSSVTDPEQRIISLGYGTPGDTPPNPDPIHNETTSITGPAGTNVANTYITDPGNPFIGRLASSETTRDDKKISRTEYEYERGAYNDPELPSYQADLTSLTVTLAWALPVAQADAAYPAAYYTRPPDRAYLEKQTAQTPDDPEVPDGPYTETVTYLDALGSALFTRSSERGSWSVSIPDPEGRTIFSASSGRHTLSAYDGAGLLVQTTQVTYDAYDAAGAPLDPEATTTEYKYDDQGRRIATIVDGQPQSSTAYTSDGSRRTETTTDAQGNQTATTTDAAGRVVSQKFTSADGDVRETTYGYDAHGRRNYTKDPRGLETFVTYDAAGRETQTTQRIQGAASTEYTTRRGYDPQGRTLWTQTPLQAQADPQVFTTYLYRVDTANATTWAVDDDDPSTPNDDTAGAQTDPSYGQLVAVYHENARLKDGNPDPYGKPSGSPDGSSDYTGYYEIYDYDDEGRQTVVVKPAQLTPGGPIVPVKTVTAYNDDGQAATVTFNADVAPTVFTFDYDPQGNRSQVMYPSGLKKAWTYEYDADERPTRLVESHPAEIPADARWKTTTYDDRGRAVRLSDAVDNAIAYTYDGWRLQSRVFTPATSQGDTAHTWQYSYDDNGRIESLTRNAGDTGTGDTEYTESRTYDPATGRVASLSLSSEGLNIGTIHYGYDYAGSLDEISALGRTTLYEYDASGRISRVESPEGVQTVSYNSSGLRTRCATETDEGKYVETRTYDALGHLLTQTHTRPDGSISYQVQYTLAPDGNRLSAVETRDSEVATWDYTYDRLGRLEREQRTDSEGLGRDITYTYDADSNRVGADNALDDDLDETYTYDASGRLTRVTRGDETYTVYSWTLNGEQSQVSEFDAQDNETKRQEFAWGGAGDRTLESVTFYESDGSGGLAPQGRVEYDYDHAGEKIARRVYDADGALRSHRKYLVDHQNPTGYSQTLAELEIVDPDTGKPSESSNATARVARLSTFDPLGPVAQTDFRQTAAGLSTTRRHLFADPLGSIRTLTSQTDSGTIESAAEDYTAFGTPIHGSLTSGEPPAATPQYAFTAQTRDPYSGLQYHRARWLNTGIGQWTSSDPVFDSEGNFGSFCGYVGQSPIANLDPSGSMTLVGKVVVASIVSMLVLSGIHNYMIGGKGGFIGGVQNTALTMIAILAVSALIVAIGGPSGIVLVAVFLAMVSLESVVMLSHGAGQAWGEGKYGLAVVRICLLLLVIVNAALMPGFLKTAWNRAQTKMNARSQEIKPGKFSPLLEWEARMIDSKKFRFARGGRSAKGYPRDYKEFWRLWRQAYSETLSAGNKAKVDAGKAPIVDEHWVRYYPEHEPFMGMKLEHHHLRQGRWTIPLPRDFHRGRGWQGFWHDQGPLA